MVLHRDKKRVLATTDLRLTPCEAGLPGQDHLIEQLSVKNRISQRLYATSLLSTLRTRAGSGSDRTGVGQRSD